jgi:hypothetical protein
MPGNRDQQVALLVIQYTRENTHFAISCFWQIQISSASALTRFMRVQCQSHHLWFTLFTFGKQDVQGVVEMFQEIVWTRESGSIDKLVVITYRASASLTK